MFVPTHLRRLAFRFGIKNRHDIYWTPINYVRRRFIDPLYPQYGLDELADYFQRLGFRSGRSVLVHSGWSRFNKCKAKPNEIIQLMIDLLGKDGTLVMPAYPLGNDPDAIFDVCRTPTRAGLLCETFRRYPGVRRSINFHHSVAALGPAADYLTADHHKSFTPWDESSPHYRMKFLDSVSACIGTPAYFSYGIPEHCAESILRTEIYYFSLVFGPPCTYTYRDWDGVEGTYTAMPRTATIQHRKLWPYYDKNKTTQLKVSNLRMHAIDLPYFIDRVIELGRNKITQFSKPEPHPELFFRINDNEPTAEPWGGNG